MIHQWQTFNFYSVRYLLQIKSSIYYKMKYVFTFNLPYSTDKFWFRHTCENATSHLFVLFLKSWPVWQFCFKTRKIFFRKTIHKFTGKIWKFPETVLKSQLLLVSTHIFIDIVKNLTNKSHLYFLVNFII